MGYFQILLNFRPAIWSLSVFFFSLYLLLSLRKWFRMYIMCQRLPGPAQHPILGHAKEYLSKQKFLGYCMKWRESFPHFYRTNILFFPLIIIQSPEAVQLILSRRKHAEKGVIYQTFMALLGEGLITSKGEKWVTHRKMITPTFHFNILESFVEVFVDKTKQFMERLESTDKSDFLEISLFTHKLTLDFICEKKLSVFFLYWYMKMHWNPYTGIEKKHVAPFLKKFQLQFVFFIIETAMGTTINAQQEESKQLKIVETMHNLEDIAIYRVVHPWLLSELIFPFSKYKKLETKNKEVLHSFTLKVIQERREALKALTQEPQLERSQKRKAIFMDMLIENTDDNRLLTDTEIREEVSTFIFAGQNTTQLAINYCLFLVGQNPDIEDKIYEEMKQIFGDSDRYPTMEDLRRMNYLERCVKETLRLYPSIPVIGRKLTEDETIGKHVLPAGANILILPYVLHRDPTQFPNPEQFNPDNFLPEHIQGRHPYAYIPFSAGPRNCIGAKFAMLAIKTTLSSVFRKYKIESKTKQKDLICVASLVLVPKSGIRLKLIPRTDALIS